MLIQLINAHNVHLMEHVHFLSQIIDSETVLEINFFCRYQVLAGTCDMVFKAVAKLTYPVANIGGCVTAWLPPIVNFMTKQNSIWSKALIMPLTIWNCVLSINIRIISVKIGLFFQEITFRTEFPGSNFLLPTFLTGGKFATCYC